MASDLGPAVRREPTLVTTIVVDGVEKRVKLVFHHHHFNRPDQLRALNPAERLRCPSLLAPGEIMAAEELPQLVCSIKAPGGTMRFWPRGVTVARLVDWPRLESVQQGDGDRRQEEVLATGYAVCSAQDNYKKAEGRHIALKNLLDSSALPGPARHEVALCYANRVPKRRRKRVIPPVIADRDPGDETLES